PELGGKVIDEVGAHLDIAIECLAHIALAIASVVSAGKAIDTRVRAAEVRVQAPIERHSLDAVESTLRLYLLISDRTHFDSSSMRPNAVLDARKRTIELTF